MEKVIYALWRESGTNRENFNARLLEDLAPQLQPLVHGLRFNIQDDAVAGASAPRFSSTQPLMEAFVQLWVDSAVDHLREAVDRTIAPFAARYAAWLVSESAVLPNRAGAGPLGQRLRAYNHIAVISIPPRLTWRAWQDIWQNHHTQVAVETQSNFEYLQNLIVRPLTYAAAPYAAIIEESFPSEAMIDEAAFLDAIGDPARLAANRERLYRSTFSFVDEGGFDLIPTSQYDFKRLGL